MDRMSKDDLFQKGTHHINTWCDSNKVDRPKIEPCLGSPTFGVCAYYRDGVIHIWVKSCAEIGLAGRQWSWPGYVVDRTPYGVLAHELGHHVDKAHGARGGKLSHAWRVLDPEPLTSYCPNNNEWFAELFRLFVTNPDLMRHVRPKIFGHFLNVWPVTAEHRPWQVVLEGSVRHQNAAQNKIRATFSNQGRLF